MVYVIAISMDIVTRKVGIAKGIRGYVRPPIPSKIFEGTVPRKSV
jgi:hypothetical protein